MSFKILHTADLHLGKSFRGLPPERAEQRRADQLTTLHRLCRTACQMNVDVLCIAGDLFDYQRPSTSLLATVRSILSDAGIPVLLVPGNHDPLEAQSPYLEDRWPGNVIVANQPGWQNIDIGGYETLAFGYTLGEAHRSPWDVAFPGCSDDALIVLHAACLASGLVRDSGYYPFTPQAIPRCGYLALGHHHRSSQVSSSPSAWYAGSPEPLEPEVTPATALLVTLHGASATVEPIDVATRHHRLVSIDITGLSIDEIWSRALAAATTDNLLTLRLVGMLDDPVPLDSTALSSELSARCFAVEVVTNEVQLPITDGGEGTLKVLHDIAADSLATLASDDPQRKRIERAVRYAVLALEGKL